MKGKALRKTIWAMSIILLYIGVIALLAWKDCQVGIIIICVPLVFSGLACMAISLYDHFKNEENKK